MYALVLVMVMSSGASTADTVEITETLYDCFDARDTVLVEHRAWDGYLGAGLQAVCVRIEE